MTTTAITPDEKMLDMYPALFGTSKLNNKPLYAYAESLFYAGMDQMVEGYASGSFDYVVIVETDVETEETAFVPLSKSNKIVAINSPFGPSATVSSKAASFIVWIFCLDQIAGKTADEIAKERIYCTIQDLKHCADTMRDESGNFFFEEKDNKAIYKLLN